MDRRRCFDKSSEIIVNRKFILKSQNTRRTPMYAGGVPAAFGVAKSPGGGGRDKPGVALVSTERTVDNVISNNFNPIK